MATNKKPNHKRKQPIAANPLQVMRIQSTMEKENLKARKAGKEYGALAMGMICLMATIHCDNVKDIQAYFLKASEVLGMADHMPFPEIIKATNTLMESNVTAEQLIEADPTLRDFL